MSGVVQYSHWLFSQYLSKSEEIIKEVMIETKDKL